MRFGEGHGAGWSAGKEGRSLGYSKLTYEEYIENPEFYLARGILAPKWANELYPFSAENLVRRSRAGMNAT